MKIQCLDCIDGAKRARGLTVIIDVFRAFTLECYLFAAGAEKIYPIADLKSAFSLKQKHPDWLLFGERKGAKVKGCDYGNSPSEVDGIDFTGKTLIHTTSAGTQGIIHATKASEIITGSLVNAKAVASYIEMRNPDIVSIVGMGDAGIHPNREDQLCEKYIQAILEHKEMDIQKAADDLQYNGAEHFFDPKNTTFPLEDFYKSTACNTFDFVIKVHQKDNYYICEKAI